MASPRHSTILLLCLIFLVKTESASIFDKSYEYVKGLAPSFVSFLDCFREEDLWNCAKMKAGKLMNNMDDRLDEQRRSWREEADAEVISSGRSLEEMPSKVGKEIETSLGQLSDLVQLALARTISKQDHDDSSGGLEDVADTLPDQDAMLSGMRKSRGLLEDTWGVGQKVLDDLAEYALDKDNKEDGIEDKSSLTEQRGKKKKKKKAILKLLILGAVLKAKIGTILQILSFKLQVKFLLIALAGLIINAARFWVDLKSKHHQPQKVIYYEHAQHQHHYDHEDEHEQGGWGGPWSRSIDPEEPDVEVDLDLNNSPYRGQHNVNHPRAV